jgi:hypothetical protein
LPSSRGNNPGCPAVPDGSRDHVPDKLLPVLDGPEEIGEKRGKFLFRIVFPADFQTVPFDETDHELRVSAILDPRRIRIGNETRDLQGHLMAARDFLDQDDQMEVLVGVVVSLPDEKLLPDEIFATARAELQDLAVDLL